MTFNQKVQFIFKLQVKEKQCHKPTVTLNSFLMLFHKASLKLAMYWGMLAEEGIPEVEKSAFEINFLLKNIQ